MNILYDDKIIELFSRYKNNEEIEARFGFFDRDFKPGISRSDYTKLRKYLVSQGYFETETLSIVSIENGIRRIETIKEGEDSEIVYQKKETILNKDLKNYGIRISVSSEIDIYDVNIDSKLQRTRHRFSYIIDNKYKIDLTEIMQTNFSDKINLKKSQNNYELEVAVIDKNNLKLFFEFLANLYLVLKDSKNFYTNIDIKKLNEDIGKLINNDYYKNYIKITNPNKIYRRCLVQARSLNKFDLCYDGIINGKGAPYYVTYKADGLRKMLIIHTTGIWICYPPNEYNLVIKYGIYNFIDQFINNYNGTVLDGELINLFNKKSEFNFLVFDCIIFKKNNLFNISYNKRLSVIEEIFINFIKNDILNIELKNVYRIGNPSDFFLIINKMLNDRESLNYNDDGLIFTPSQTFYNPFTDEFYKNNKNKYKLTLQNYPDVCKWKPPIEMTIDFMIEKSFNHKIKLMVSKEINGIYTTVLFKGTRKYPLNDNMIDHYHPLTEKLPSGTIVEYIITMNNNIPYLIPKKERPDKISANKEDVAKDIWEQIMDPILEDTIRGKNLKLVFFYHNRIKNKLLESLRDNTILLDIGSGYGGDIGKWKRFSKVIAIEPKYDNFYEFLKRSEGFNLKTHLYPILARGQDYTLIENAMINYNNSQKVDAISAMLSLSFFWKNKVSIQSLVATLCNRLKKGGNFIFLTIDGDILNQRFDKNKKIINYLESTFQIQEYFNDNDYGQEVSIQLDSSKIVGHQIEFFVYFNFLTRMLEENGFKKQYINIANEELLLTNEQRNYSSLYIYGSFIKIKTVNFHVSNEILLDEFLYNYSGLSNFILVLDINLEINIKNKNIEYIKNLTSDKIKFYKKINFLLICNKDFIKTDIFEIIKPEAYLAL